MIVTDLRCHSEGGACAERIARSVPPEESAFQNAKGEILPSKDETRVIVYHYIQESSNESVR